MCRSLHFFYLLKRWGLQWDYNHQELISGYYLSVSGWGLQRLLSMMFTSAEPNIDHHIPITFCLTPSFVLWLLCWCVSLLQQNCHQRSSRFQGIQHSTCNIYIRAHVCVYIYIYFWSSFLQGDRSNATEALGRGQEKVRVGFVVLSAGGKSDIKRVPFKIWGIWRVPNFEIQGELWLLTYVRLYLGNTWNLRLEWYLSDWNFKPSTK